MFDRETTPERPLQGGDVRVLCGHLVAQLLHIFIYPHQQLVFLQQKQAKFIINIFGTGTS